MGIAVGTSNNPSGAQLGPNGRCTFAQRRVDRAWVGVLDVPKGLKCDCICPECGSALVARKGPVRSAHFSHPSQAGGCGMGFWHEVIRDSLAELSLIDLGRIDAVPRLSGQQRILCARREQSVLDGEYQLDVMLWLQSGLKVAVEVVDTCDIDGLKFVALEQEGFQVLRIDVAAVRKAMHHLPPTTENLKSLLASAGGWQSWPRVYEEPVQESLALLANSYPRHLGSIIRSCLHGLTAVGNSWTHFEHRKGGQR